jgi:pimeloyl-ACP methyl ester carboxylesterase/DNA-binding CsgD family transcriptional regulator
MRKDTLDAVFSLLPRRNADFAIQQLHERLVQPFHPEAFEIHWAEFELSGTFVRGGISDIADLSTRIVTDSQTDAAINLLASRARTGTLRAGLLEWNRESALFLWYLPYRFFDSKGKPGTRLRGLVITGELFSEIMEQFNGDLKLTPAEKRTLFQLVGGLELREAAELDDVTYDTKRAHTKALCGKMDCGGQKDLVRWAMGQLTHLTSISDTDLKYSEPAVTLVEDYLYQDMQLVIRRHRSGETLRYLVGGPANGTPAILVHGMMFPVILRGVSTFLYKHNIRLIVPIRRGYMESSPLASLFDQGNLIEQGLRAIACVIEEEGLDRVPLIGNSLGGIVALRMAQERPQLFSSLVLLSPNLARPSSEALEDTGSFYKGMHDLKSDSLLFKLVNLEYRKFYSNTETCGHILKTHFAKNEVDLKVMDGFYTGHSVYDMFAHTYTTSIVGIAEDFMYVMQADTFDAERLAMPLSVIHGDDDPLTSFAEIAAAIKTPPAGIQRRIAGAGHFAAISHGDQVWGDVARACTLKI